MIDWKQIKSLPADGSVRVVGGFEAVHHPRTTIRAACVMVHEGDTALRSIQSADGRWSRPDRVNWNHGNR